MSKVIYFLFLSASFNIFSHSTLAQEPLKPRPSPLNVISMKYMEAYVKIVYSQPHKNGRQLFGELVPYGKVWRTGANEATEITLTHDIMIASETLRAGTYSIFSIPEENEWTIIFNSELGLWGAYNYNPKKDVLRVNANAEANTDALFEPFTIIFEQRNDMADLIFLWDRVRVKIPIRLLQTKS
jgi:hypothetical protein